MFLNRERAYEIMAAHNLQGIVASRPHNVTYLTGYERKLGFALLPPIRAFLSRDPAAPIILLIPPVELTTVAAQTVWADEIETSGEFWVYIPQDAQLTEVETRFRDLWQASKPFHEPFDALKTILNRLGMVRGRVAFDETGIGYELRDSALPDLAPIAGDSIFREIRLIKTPDEITLLNQVTHINEQAGHVMYNACRAGAAWDDIVQQHAVALAQQGAVQQFVSSAPGQLGGMIFPLEGHNIHLKQGEWVRHDYGATYHSYWSDTGRTVSLGEPNEPLKTYYAACRSGLEAVTEQLKPGARLGELFALAMNTIRKAGIPQYGRAHIGHTIGLELYDGVNIKPDSTVQLQADMVLNVELPYYELGWGGLQIEDTFLITSNGAQRLTTSAHDLIINE